MSHLIIVVNDLVAFNSHEGISILQEERLGWKYAGMLGLSVLAGNPKWRPVAIALADAFDLDPDRLVAALAIAFEHWQDPHIVDACGGNMGPLADCGLITFEEYERIVAAFENEQRIIEATKTAKRSFMRSRRSQFAAQRDALVLALLDSGVPYKCNHPGCEVVGRLTLDHRIPLSRGGADGVSNLQFLCLSHNSSKGDRT